MSNPRTFAVIAHDTYYPSGNNIYGWYETYEEAEAIASELEFSGTYDRAYVHDFTDDIFPPEGTDDINAGPVD